MCLKMKKSDTFLYLTFLGPSGFKPINVHQFVFKEQINLLDYLTNVVSATIVVSTTD